MTNLYKTINGDLLEATGFIIHGCNNLGIMGSGVARGIKNRFPGAYQIYNQAFQANQLALGSITVWRVSNEKWIVNAVTQTLGDQIPLKLQALSESFEAALNFIIVTELSEKRILGSIPICFPLIGAGRGGGDWNIINSILNKTLKKHNADYLITRPANLYVIDTEPVDCT